MRAKEVDFEVTYIDLRDKPDWFLEISPHGKVPVLQVDGQPLFESNAIAEFLDEAVAPRLHPADLVTRARHRAWTDYVPNFAAGISIYYAKDAAGVEAKLPGARNCLAKLSQALAADAQAGPYFGGDKLCLVDAAYAPFLQRFLLVDEWLGSGLLEEYPTVAEWANHLLADTRVQNSVPDNFTEEFIKNMHRRELYVAQLIPQASAG